ncbi:hypothetical protein [Rhodopirellula sp. MGV]|uniref:hypothetical protein n=1 Tax=Rhodopirellula sp. MGV TaxID=2023130 RepID=UPI000B973749|nr:hypothetical protein [Rhodopirellula sp. MGV]OYP33156.1 hypothetical protein CGZ80_18205 [Rhodopirellula sp. MGV]PNY35115.1 hypothetical protein C2E31_19615 [Rhodopirellula baltica]PNY37108.1 hypothetical protein C2E31_09725 [Rhodopirellula baltica]
MMSGDNKDRITDEEFEAYVAEQIQINPVWDSATILRRRRELFGLQTRTSETPVRQERSRTTDTVRLREHARQTLSRLQRDFYSLPIEQLASEIDALDNDQIPEYAARVTQFRRIANHRNELLELPNILSEPAFVETLHRSLVASHAASGQLWESYIAEAVASRVVSQRVHVAIEFRNKFPDLYDLSRAWIDEICDPSNFQKWKRESTAPNLFRNFIQNRGVQCAAAAFLISVVVVTAKNDKVRDQQDPRAPTQPNLRRSLPGLPRYQSPLNDHSTQTDADDDATSPPQPDVTAADVVDMMIENYRKQAEQISPYESLRDPIPGLRTTTERMQGTNGNTNVQD